MTVLAALLLFLAFGCVQLWLGALTILTFGKMVPARWIRAIEPALRDLLRWTPWSALGLAALFLARSALYPWSDASTLEPGAQTAYYHPALFAARNLLVVGLWVALTRRILKDRVRAAPVALLMLLFTGTLMATDWLQSLDPHWKSTAFGMIVISDAVLTAFGLAVARASGRETESSARIDLGTLHFVLIGSWAYLNFTSFLIIWSANIPAEAGWYVARSTHGWQAIPAALSVTQFMGPLVLLLFRVVKNSPRAERALGLLTFANQAVWLAWMIFPAFFPGGAP